VIVTTQRLDVGGIESHGRGTPMRANLYLQRVVALAVLAAWSVAVHLRERVAAPADTARSVPAKPTPTHSTHADRLRWN
jgi:hypothetical protein